MSKHSQRAMELFKEGYSCAQSVFGAFYDETDMDFEAALKMSSSFGGGMGRLREVCGAVSSIFLVAGIKYGYSSPNHAEEKTEHYQLIQTLAQKFKEQNGSIICRELLELADGPDTPVPQNRTEQYYKIRPCVQLVGYAAELLDQLIENKNNGGLMYENSSCK